MSSYNLNEGSADFQQSDGTALVNSEIAIDNGTAMRAGGVVADGPLNSVDTINTGRYGGGNVGGVNGAGAASWVIATTGGSVANASSPWVGSMLVTHSSHGKAVNDVVRLSDSSDVYTNVYRIVAVISANTYVVNGAYISNVGSVTVSYGSAKSATDSTVKPVGNLVAGEYAARIIGLPVYNGVTTVDTLSSPTSDYGRRKVHSRTAVRSHGVAAAIRAGYYDIYSGTFSTAPTESNDFAAFGDDDEVADNPYDISVGGEFAYRYGLTVTQDQYGRV